MYLLDYTHPDKVPPLHLPNDRRDARYYLRLDELEKGHPYQSSSWSLFRSPEWLEGGSAWLQAHFIDQDIRNYTQSAGLSGSNSAICPVIGSGDVEFDEAVAAALRTFGYSPKVAEMMPRRSVAK
jgi:hypothetical protein